MNSQRHLVNLTEAERDKALVDAVKEVCMSDAQVTITLNALRSIRELWEGADDSTFAMFNFLDSLRYEYDDIASDMTYDKQMEYDAKGLAETLYMEYLTMSKGKRVTIWIELDSGFYDTDEKKQIILNEFKKHGYTVQFYTTSIIVDPIPKTETPTSTEEQTGMDVELARLTLDEST